MRQFALYLCTHLCFSASLMGQDAVTALSSNNLLSEKIARIQDFSGVIKQIRITVPKEKGDSIVFFDGDCTNIYQVIHRLGKKNRYHLDPEKISKIEMDGRIFESHNIRVYGKGISNKCFVERFYTSPQLEMFEGVICNAGGTQVSYYVKLPGSPYLTVLDGVCGTSMQTVDEQAVLEEKSTKETLMPMSRRSMKAIGTQLAESRE